MNWIVSFVSLNGPLAKMTLQSIYFHGRHGAAVVWWGQAYDKRIATTWVGHEQLQIEA